MAELDPTDFDSGRIWLCFQGAAVCVVLMALMLLAVALLSEPGVTVEGEGDVPPGHSYYVVEGADGVDSVIVVCPSLVDSFGDELGPLCGDRRPRTIAIVVGSVTTAGLCVWAFVLAGRHRRRVRAQRTILADADELLTYRQDSMPWGYWTAFIVVGCFGVLNLVVFIVTLVREGTSDIRGPMVWGPITFGVLWAYGFRKSYELSIEGDEIRLRTPFRTDHVPLASIRAGEVRRTGIIGERHAVLHTAQGRQLSVVVPNARHERRFRAFCDAVANRSRSFERPAL